MEAVEQLTKKRGIDYTSVSKICTALMDFSVACSVSQQPWFPSLLQYLVGDLINGDDVAQKTRLAALTCLLHLSKVEEPSSCRPMILEKIVDINVHLEDLFTEKESAAEQYGVSLGRQHEIMLVIVLRTTDFKVRTMDLLEDFCDGNISRLLSILQMVMKVPSYELRVRTHCLRVLYELTIPQTYFSSSTGDGKGSESKGQASKKGSATSVASDTSLSERDVNDLLTKINECLDKVHSMNFVAVLRDVLVNSPAFTLAKTTTQETELVMMGWSCVFRFVQNLAKFSSKRTVANSFRDSIVVAAPTLITDALFPFLHTVLKMWKSLSVFASLGQKLQKTLEGAWGFLSFLCGHSKSDALLATQSCFALCQLCISCITKGELEDPSKERMYGLFFTFVVNADLLLSESSSSNFSAAAGSKEGSRSGGMMALQSNPSSSSLRDGTPTNTGSSGDISPERLGGGAEPGGSDSAQSPSAILFNALATMCGQSTVQGVKRMHSFLSSPQGNTPLSPDIASYDMLLSLFEQYIQPETSSPIPSPDRAASSSQPNDSNAMGGQQEEERQGGGDGGLEEPSSEASQSHQIVVNSASTSTSNVQGGRAYNTTDESSGKAGENLQETPSLTSVGSLPPVKLHLNQGYQPPKATSAQASSPGVSGSNNNNNSNPNLKRTTSGHASVEGKKKDGAPRTSKKGQRTRKQHFSHPPEFCCELSQNIMANPVIVKSTGHRYEQAVLRAFIDEHGPFDPITKQRLPVGTNNNDFSEVLKVDTELQKKITEYLVRQALLEGEGSFSW